MIEEGDPIYTLMVSYFMQKDTDDDGMMSNGGGGGGGGRRRTPFCPKNRTIGPPIQEGVSFRSGGNGNVP